MKREAKFNPYEQVILRALIRARRKLTTKQIAEMIGISWSTVSKHVANLRKKGYLESLQLSNKIYWEIKIN